MILQHQNIIRLVGYCYEIAHKVMEYNGQYVYAGAEERALCFEYLQGGSLDKHLSGMIVLYFDYSIFGSLYRKIKEEEKCSLDFMSW